MVGRKKLTRGFMAALLVFSVQPGALAYYKEKLASPDTVGSLIIAPIQEPPAAAIPREADLEQPGSGKGEPITSSGRAVPLGIAVHLIVPAKWNVTVSPDIARREVSWNANSRNWPAVLNEVASEAKVTATLDWNIQKATLEATASPPQNQRQETDKNPIPANPPQPEPISLANGVLPSSPTASVSRSISPGSLSTQLLEWCSASGYQLVWKVSHDLNMTSHAVFHGSFSQALADMFAGLAKAGHPLRITVYEGNRVVEVVEE